VRIFVISADPGIAPDGTKGASVHLRSITRALVAEGHQVTLLSARRPDHPGAARTVPVRPFEGRRSVDQAARLSGPPDLVYERYSLGGLEGLADARDLGSAFALEVNAPLVLEATRHRPDTLQPHHHEAERRLFREADVIFAVSEPLRRYVAEARGTDRGTSVLRNGCDPELFPDPAPLDGDGLPTVVFLGHPKPWHGADALPLLLADIEGRGCPARLLLIGGGPGARTVLDEAGRMGLAARVEVTGPLSPPAAARRLVDATVAVAPYPPQSFFYFCPIKIVEYMAAGLPVVAPSLGDIPDVLNGTGMLVPPGDRDAMTSAVQALLEDPGLRRDLAERARHRALSELTWDGVAARLIERVTEVIREREAVA
jgi:glycosyltransferase involved in cell wall biosynthesis